jgi:hypothetical protein
MVTPTYIPKGYKAADYRSEGDIQEIIYRTTDNENDYFIYRIQKEMPEPKSTIFGKVTLAQNLVGSRFSG